MCLKFCGTLIVQWNSFSSQIFSHTQRPQNIRRKILWNYFLKFTVFDFTKLGELIKQKWTFKADIVSMRNHYWFIYCASNMLCAWKPHPCPMEGGVKIWLNQKTRVLLSFIKLIYYPSIWFSGARLCMLNFLLKFRIQV